MKNVWLKQRYLLDIQWFFVRFVMWIIDYRANSFMGIPHFKSLVVLCWKFPFTHPTGLCWLSNAFFSYVKAVWTKWQRLIIETASVLQHTHGSFTASHVPTIEEKLKLCLSFFFRVKGFVCFLFCVWKRYKYWERKVCPTFFLYYFLSFICLRLNDKAL